MTLVDDSMKSVKCTLWGDLALNFDMNQVGRVVALKDASVGDFGGRSLSLGRNGEVDFNPEDERATQVSFKYSLNIILIHINPCWSTKNNTPPGQYNKLSKSKSIQ